MQERDETLATALDFATRLTAFVDGRETKERCNDAIADLKASADRPQSLPDQQEPLTVVTPLAIHYHRVLSPKAKR